ncbi:helix-turn-helix transcriptional regulator [Pontibacter sp. FD36]|uniref:helix-turn-helix domain-containing protein n=1 Tax=Pontibacter sp. FD36 TaxID=2789860 RepID=UPI0018ABFA30|nr:AraC family transcriptional regulator [Pontibacter sp. FD36]MBF8964073.1 helix-turn-helix transcriptional regulator [Pontibacter sp. FD36]
MSSFFTSFEDQVRPRGLGIKFAAEGQEDYWLQGKRYSVSQGRYFLVNDSVPSLDVTIKNKATWSVCVDIDAQLVNDVLQQWLHPNDLDSHHHISRYLLTPDLFIREAEASNHLQRLLTNLITSSASQTLQVSAIELIYELTSLVIEENKGVVDSYYRLQTAKSSTRKEVFRRLLVGKEVLDDSLFTELSMKEVAEACCMSEFRFYRLFRQCFGDSPYNYLFKKRIDKSIELKKQGQSWVEIATLLNFTDLSAFSKSFKKVMGVSPSKAIL